MAHQEGTLEALVAWRSRVSNSPHWPIRGTSWSMGPWVREVQRILKNWQVEAHHIAAPWLWSPHSFCGVRASQARTFTSGRPWMLPSSRPAIAVCKKYSVAQHVHRELQRSCMCLKGVQLQVSSACPSNQTALAAEEIHVLSSHVNDAGVLD